MADITILRAPEGLPHAKRFGIVEGEYQSEPIRFSSTYDVEARRVEGLTQLSEILTALENQPSACVIRGMLREGYPSTGVHRRYAGANASFIGQACQWLCVDIDELEAPDELPHFNDQPNLVAEYAVSHLPPEFSGIDFHWQLSGSMGVKPGIRVHLWFWLSRPITDQEAKAWLSDAMTKVDLILYTPIQPHFTAFPIFEAPAKDPVDYRSDLFEYGLGNSVVPVPDDLDTKILELQRSGTRTKRTSIGDRLDPSGIVRDEDGLVVDGREKFLFLKSIDATRELTRGATLLQDIPSLDDIANRTWDLFAAEADLSDGRWTRQDAKEKAEHRLRALDDGWQPNGRFETTTLISGVEPYFNLEAMPAADGANLLSQRLDEFLATVPNADVASKKMALRITMGSGKTTATVTKIKALLNENPDLNVEFYVPRHDLIGEVIDHFEELHPQVDLIHMKGRGHDHENGNAPCLRYAYVQSLEQAGLSVRSNACWRSDLEQCEHYNDCAYFQQFRHRPGKLGSVRIFPHAYLAQERISTLPAPDLIIIDEAFLSAIQEEKMIPGERLRQVVNQATGSELGDRLVNALRGGDPVLTVLRELAIGQPELLGIELDTGANLSFNGQMNHARGFPNAGEIRERQTAEVILKALGEEIGNEDRTQVSRLRYDPRTGEIVLNRVRMDGINQDTNILFLDATADYSILNHLFGDLEFHRIDIDQKAYVTQVYDRTGSNTSWRDGEDRIEDLTNVIGTHSEIGYRVLCVANKELADQLRELNLGENAAIAHFGNIRGIDEFRDHDAIFITGRNQPPQSDIDGQARALWWNDDQTLDHDDAALLGAPPETDLPKELRGYLTTDPEQAAGVYVRAFRDCRIEAVHQQVREAETVQAIARLRLVHSERVKNVYLLGNLPIEMPVNRLMAWNDLMPNEAELQLIEKGNVPLTPLGWMKMRPDLASNENQAKNLNKRQGIRDQSSVLEASPLFVRLGCMVLSFKQVRDGKLHGRTQQHLFRTRGVIDEDRNGVTAPVPVDEWIDYLTNGNPEVEGSGWGPIAMTDLTWMNAPGQLIPYPEGDEDSAEQ